MTATGHRVILGGHVVADQARLLRNAYLGIRINIMVDAKCRNNIHECCEGLEH